jgi:hypothetical protein
MALFTNGGSSSNTFCIPSVMVVLFNHACQPRVLSGWLLRRERGDNFFKAWIATQGIRKRVDRIRFCGREEKSAAFFARRFSLQNLPLQAHEQGHIELPSVSNRAAVDTVGLPSSAHGQIGETQWQTNPNAPIQPGVWFSLWNVSAGKYVNYGKRTWGINLVWQAKNEPPLNFTIARSSGSNEPLRYGELIALRERKGGYLKYKQREYGITLGWSSSAVFEWEVQGGPPGDVVNPRKLGDYPSYISDTLFALYNRSSRSFIVYGERTFGINLTWMKTVRDHRSH